MGGVGDRDGGECLPRLECECKCVSVSVERERERERIHHLNTSTRSQKYLAVSE